MIRRLLAVALLLVAEWSLVIAPTQAAINARVTAAQLPAFAGGECTTTVGSVAVSCNSMRTQSWPWSAVQYFGKTGSSGYVTAGRSASSTPGYVEIFDSSDVRWGYIGFSNGNNIVLSGDNGHGVFLPGAFATTPAVGSNDTTVDTTANSQNRLSHVANVAAVAGWANTAFPVEVDGFATPGDGGRHRMVYDGANACGAGGHPAADALKVVCVNSTVSGQTGSWNIDWGSVGNVAPAAVFGGICVGNGANAAADTAALNAALATGKNAYVGKGVCVVNAPIKMSSVTGQKLYGDGQQASALLNYVSFTGASNVQSASFTGSISGNVLTVTAVASGTLTETMVLSDGATNINANTTQIQSKGTGTGGTGTYVLNQTYGSIGSESITGSKFITGVVTIGAPAQEVENLRIYSTQQPDTTNMTAANLTLTQPAIYAEGYAALRLRSLFIHGFTTCIDAGGNTNVGNSHIDDNNWGCYLYDLRMDGSLDSPHLHGDHSFPFSMSANQAAVRAANGIMFDIGRVDDFKIDAGLCLSNKCLHIYPGTQGGPFGEIGTFDVDGATGLTIDPGTNNAQITIGTFNCSPGAAGQYCIKQYAGRLIVAGVNLFLAAGTIPFQFYGGSFTLNGAAVNDNQYDVPIFLENVSSYAGSLQTSGNIPGATISVNNVHVDRYKASAYNNPVFSGQGKAVWMGTGNSASIGGSGPFASFPDTNGNRWYGNSSPGYTNFVGNSSMQSSLSFTSGGGLYFGN